MNKVLVTGGAGFIGSHLVDRLLELGNNVVVIDNFSSGSQSNLEQHKNNKNLKIIKKDLSEDIEGFFQGVEIVFHLAANPKVQFSIENPLETHNVNVNNTLKVLEGCRKNNVKKLIYSSSASVYGDSEEIPLKENILLNPLSPYALHKLIGEQYCKLYNNLYGVKTISLRYFNVYGPRQNPSGGYASLIPKSINHIINNQKPEIYGNGEQTRDFVFVKDIVNANILASQVEDKNIFGQVFNIGGGEQISVNEIINLIIGDKDIVPLIKPPVIEPKNSLADISKAKSILNWNPRTNLQEGIKETLFWFMNNKS